MGDGAGQLLERRPAAVSGVVHVGDLAGDHALGIATKEIQLTVEHDCARLPFLDRHVGQLLPVLSRRGDRQGERKRDDKRFQRGRQAHRSILSSKQGRDGPARIWGVGAMGVALACPTLWLLVAIGPAAWPGAVLREPVPAAGPTWSHRLGSGQPSLTARAYNRRALELPFEESDDQI